MSIPFDFRMQLLLSLSREISGSLNLPQIMRFVKFSIQTFISNIVWMNIFEVEKDKLIPAEKEEKEYLIKNEKFFSELKKRKEYIYIEDLKEKKYDYFPFCKEAKSALWIPIKRWDKIEGFFGIESELVKGFKLEDVIFLRIISDFLGVSISNIKLLRENEERKKDFESAYEISLQINKPFKKEELVKTFLKLISEKFNSIYIAFFEKQGDILYLFDYYTTSNKISLPHQVLIGEEICGKSALSGKLIKEYKEDAEGIKSKMAIPVFWKENLVGVIEIGGEKDFSENEIFLANLLSNTFSLSYQNSKYYEELEKYINEMEKLVHEKTQELIKTEKFALIGQMSSVVIHEIKNLLAGISAMAEFILLKVPDEKICEVAKMMKEEVEKAFKNLSNILEYVKPIKLDLKKTRIEEVIKKALLLSQGFFEGKNIDVELNFEENLPEIVMDEDKIKEVFLNLISNAAQAIESKGFIKIRGHRKNEFVVVEVEDNGIGIKKEDIDKIFEPFFTTKKGGTGLGLARVKKILDYHLWQISVKSEINKGSIFEIKIPLKI
jgi:signal transduction histidine kinase